MTSHDPLRSLLLELALAVGMIACLVGAMVIHTGSMPPLVVVESSSMVHNDQGEIGSIDAGDLILVHDQPADTVVTFAEATDPTHPSFGYEQHGLEGDVIIYAKNGEEGTPIIHRAILRAVAHSVLTPDRSPEATSPCPEGTTFDSMMLDNDGQLGSCIATWSVPGTNAINVTSITLHFDGIDAGYYDCKRPSHSGATYVVESHLVVWQWTPSHEGYLTLGDNNQCSVDQGASATNGSAGVHSPSGVVGPIRDDWVLGVAGGEIPWLGTVKLALGGPDTYGPGDVPSSSYVALFAVVMGVLLLPQVADKALTVWLSRAPELQVKLDSSGLDEAS